jgi:gliding motility-associated-like protein/uncharacterized repeat protein (TIGR01451 family)
MQILQAQAQQPNPIRIRLGTSITIGAVSNDEFAYRWYRDGMLIANQTGSTLTTNLPGEYQVEAISRFDCVSDKSDPFLILVDYADLEVIKKSEARAVGPNETFEYTIVARNNGNTLTTNITVTDVLPSNLAFVGMDDPRAKYENGVITWLLPTLDDGESQSLRIQVQGKMDGLVYNRADISGDPGMPDPNLSNNTSTDVKRIIGDVKVPNVITPNGDGKNDTFKVDGIELYPDNTVAIFNRWGNEVFRSAGGYKNNWSGEGLSEGTYYYIIKMIGKDGKAKNIAGWVTILRDK